MTTKQFICVLLGIFCFSCFSLTVYATNKRHGIDIKRGHSSTPNCSECHTNDTDCGKCHTFHYSFTTPTYTQAELDAQVKVAVDAAKNAIITQYDPDKDGQIGLKEVIYYLQVIADNQQ